MADPAPVAGKISGGSHGSVDCQIEPGISADARDLIWSEFFASRGRGRDWVTHLPWEQDQGTFSVVATQSGNPVAALVLRRIGATPLAMVGFVCVEAASRGQGVSTALLDCASVAAHDRGLEQIVLWTAKPIVYERCGFTVCRREERLLLDLSGKPLEKPPVLVSWPGTSAGSPGLPPFALSGWTAATLAAQIVFVDTPTGPTLLDHKGDAGAVLNLAMQVRPGPWSVVLRQDDALYAQAEHRGLVKARDPGPSTMFRSLSGAALPLPYISPAFRI